MVVASIRIRLFTPGSLNCEPGASALHDCNICWKTSLKNLHSIHHSYEKGRNGWLGTWRRDGKAFFVCSSEPAQSHEDSSTQVSEPWASQWAEHIGLSCVVYHPARISCPNGQFHVSEEFLSKCEILCYTCAMVRDSLQKAVVANFLLARNRFRTNYIATFLWDSSECGGGSFPLRGYFAYAQYTTTLSAGLQAPAPQRPSSCMT